MQNQQLSDVKGKELVAAGHAFANAIGMDTPLIEIAKMVTVLATRLDCALVRGDACMQAEMVWEKAMMAAIGEDGVGCVVRAIAELKAERDALAAENLAMKSKRNAGHINPITLIPDSWYFQLTFEITNLDNMTPYQAHGAAWEQSRSHILRKIEEMACTDSNAMLIPELKSEISSVPAHLEGILTHEEKNAWLSGANSIRELILNLENQLRAGAPS